MAEDRGRLVDGRVRLLQPVDGYRAAIDPVFLAAIGAGQAGRAGPGCRLRRGRCYAVLRDAGNPEAGSPDVELDPAMFDLAKRNVALNAVGARVETDPGQYRRTAATPGARQFPPCHDQSAAPGGRHGAGRSAAARWRIWKAPSSLDAWLLACITLLRPKGVLAMVHRADRLDDLLASLRDRVGDIAVLPLWPMRDRPAKRILVRARKGARDPTSLCPGWCCTRPMAAIRRRPTPSCAAGQGIDF